MQTFESLCESNMEKALVGHELHEVYHSLFATKRSILQRQEEAELTSSVDDHQREISKIFSGCIFSHAEFSPTAYLYFYHNVALLETSAMLKTAIVIIHKQYGLF